MMGSDFYFRAKIPVAILGATSKVGQKLVQLLAHHPWFEIALLCDSLNLVGQTFGKVVSSLPSSLPDSIKNMPIEPCEIPIPCSLIFSAFHSREGFAIERELADAKQIVISCAPYEVKNHVSLIVAEVNSQQIAHFSGQQGGIVANPYSIVIGLTMALKPLIEAFGLDQVQVKAFPSAEISEPLSDQENERQILMILGNTFQIKLKSEPAMATEEDRVSVAIKLQRKANVEEIIQVWRKFGTESQRLSLPTAPFHPLNYSEQSRDKGMSVHLANLASASPLDYQFDLSFSHLMRGMAGSMLLNAELLVTEGKIYW